MTTLIETLSKDMTARAFIQTAKENGAKLKLARVTKMLQRWYKDMMADDERTFEQLYSAWEIESVFLNVTLPTMDDASDAVNDQGCTEERFTEYFINHFNL